MARSLANPPSLQFALSDSPNKSCFYRSINTPLSQPQFPRQPLWSTRRSHLLGQAPYHTHRGEQDIPDEHLSVEEWLWPPSAACSLATAAQCFHPTCLHSAHQSSHVLVTQSEKHGSTTFNPSGLFLTALPHSTCTNHFPQTADILCSSRVVFQSW